LRTIYAVICEQQLQGQDGDDTDQTRQIHGLGDVELESCAQYAIIGRDVPTQRGSGRAASAGDGQASHGANEPEAVLAWHRQVGDQDIGALLLQNIEGMASRLALGHDGALALERHPGQIPHGFVIVHNEDADAIETDTGTVQAHFCGSCAC
jgi:hypothetical protein